MTAPRREAFGDAGWGLFLASSWTWCIGMFLPLILLREWGWRGFWLFAIVNVLGAAAVGLFWTPERSRVFVRKREALLLWFSAATIAYQAFFVAWAAWAFMAPSRGGALDAAATRGAAEAGGSLWWSWLGASGVIFLLTVVGSRGASGWRMLGVIATLGSLLLWWFNGTTGWNDVGAGAAPVGELWMLAPAIALGFIVCPHLDLSFQRVVGDGAGPAAWLVFAVFFLPMLLFSASSFMPSGPAVTGPLIVWWVLQASFTAMVHAHEIRDRARQRAVDGRAPFPAAPIIVIAVVAGAVMGSPAFGSESTYLRFLGLYGAIFPAIALLLWRGYRSLGCLGYLAVAIPCFEAGFIGVRGAEDGRWAWAPLLPLGLLLGLLLAPINNGAGRGKQVAAAHG